MIYDRYYDTYTLYSRDPASREAKVYVPLDIESLAKDMDIDPDIIFGRLYYHLNHKFSYRQEDGSRVDLFLLRIGGDKEYDTNCIHYPYLASILADLSEHRTRFLTSTIIAGIAIVIAIASLIFTAIQS
jgi:hypothetical protein